MVTFGEAIKLYFTNYVNFKGRASRSEFWWAMLFLFILGFVVGLIDAAISGGGFNGDPSSALASRVSPLTTIVNLGTLLPSIAIVVRRLHDIGKRGWWIFLAYAPAIAAVVAFVMLLVIAITNYSTGSSDGANATLMGLLGFVILVGIASIVTGIIFLVWMCKPSVGPNQWGYPSENNSAGFNGYNQYVQPQGYGYQPQQQYNQQPQQSWPQPGMPQQPVVPQQHPGYISPQPPQPAPPAESLQSPFKYGPPQTPGVPPTPPQNNSYMPPQFNRNPFQPKDNGSAQ